MEWTFDSIVYAIGFVTMCALSLAVVALVFRIDQGAEAWAYLRESVNAWPSETWKNLHDYFVLRARHRMYLDYETWGYTAAKAARESDRRCERQRAEVAKLIADPERAKIRERIASYGRGHRNAAPPIQFPARRKA